MTNPSPRKPSKVTHQVSPDGLTHEYLIDIYEVNTVVPEALKAALEKRKRERLQKKAESDKKAENDNGPPPTDDKKQPLE